MFTYALSSRELLFTRAPLLFPSIPSFSQDSAEEEEEAFPFSGEEEEEEKEISFFLFKHPLFSVD